MAIVILYGTESGTAEFVSADLADRLEGVDSVLVSDMSDYSVEDLTPEDFYVIVCSTHGEGSLPESAQPFYDSLTAEAPDIVGLRYAMFGMGDSSYEETYSTGSETIDAKLAELGGIRVGEYGRHDASSQDAASDVALEWVEGIIPLVSSGTTDTD